MSNKNYEVDHAYDGGVTNKGYVKDDQQSLQYYNSVERIPRVQVYKTPADELAPPPYSSGNRNNTAPANTDYYAADGMRPVASMTESEKRAERISIWKNVCVISIAFIFLFTAFNSMGNVQVNTPDPL